MKSTFALLFFLKKPKGYQKGKVPIYLRVTLNGKRSESTVNRSCDPIQWNSHAGRLKGTKEEVKSINHYLDSLQNKAYDAHRELFDAGDNVSAKGIRDKIFGKAQKQFLLIEIFKEHNSKMHALIGQEYTAGTYCRYQTSLKHTHDFLKWKYNVHDMDIKKIDHAFIMDYEFYLKSVRKCGNNSSVKYIKNFGKIIRICLASGWITSNPFVNYKSKVKQVDRVFLTTDELALLAEKSFITERLSFVRDIFLFCCFTGLAYADIKKLKRSEIVTGVDGELWINTSRQKTSTASRIPLLPSALEIIRKYDQDPYCEQKGTVFPILSNQKMNAYLKEIVDVCGIKKQITFHIAI
ncbi:site-specific integrase [Sphingobacterium sp. Mn56C]|uniref:site-specific integrase n=1 Tax=Sphingobacterium sp. Mn56C TaxID=3395261 RepID=UPI003BDF5DB4